MELKELQIFDNNKKIHILEYIEDLDTVHETHKFDNIQYNEFRLQNGKNYIVDSILSTEASILIWIYKEGLKNDN